MPKGTGASGKVFAVAKFGTVAESKHSTAEIRTRWEFETLDSWLEGRNKGECFTRMRMQMVSVKDGGI